MKSVVISYVNSIFYVQLSFMIWLKTKKITEILDVYRGLKEAFDPNK